MSNTPFMLPLVLASHFCGCTCFISIPVRISGHLFMCRYWEKTRSMCCESLFYHSCYLQGMPVNLENHLLERLKYNLMLTLSTRVSIIGAQNMMKMARFQFRMVSAARFQTLCF